MTAFFGFCGFVLGVLAGLMLVSALTKHISRDQLLGDKKNRWQYGAIVWLCAGIGIIAGLLLKHYTF